MSGIVQLLLGDLSAGSGKTEDLQFRNSDLVFFAHAEVSNYKLLL